MITSSWAEHGTSAAGCGWVSGSPAPLGCLGKKPLARDLQACQLLLLAYLREACDV